MNFDELSFKFHFDWLETIVLILSTFHFMTRIIVTHQVDVDYSMIVKSYRNIVTLTTIDSIKATLKWMNDTQWNFSIKFEFLRFVLKKKNCTFLTWLKTKKKQTTIKQILLLLKNKIVKTKSNANNSKTQFFFSYSKTMSSTSVNNLKQYSMKRKIFYLFMIFQASKFKAKKVAKINIWIKKINHFEIVKFDLFYRHNFVSMIFIETFKIDNSITY